MNKPKKGDGERNSGRPIQSVVRKCSAACLVRLDALAF